MQHNNLIRNINPSVISTIQHERGYRWSKPHPYYYKLHKSKYGMFAWKNDDGIFGSYWNSARVNIYGSDGDLLKSIRCKSNASALSLRDELMVELDNWVRSSKGKDYE